MAELIESDREQAQRLRREWMTLLGCDAAEIEEMCGAPGCSDPEAEREHLGAAQLIVQRNSNRWRDLWS